LRNVTGCFESGKVTVIIGPSGSGKTTLLKILSDQQSFKEGSIKVNGAERNRATFRRQLCYVPQQFDLLPFLTAKETLYIAARLKLEADRSKQEVYVIVSDII
jgi:ABC-type multidrug transport system ATPase subunit